MRPVPSLAKLLLSLASPSLQAAVLTVGPDGLYPDLQTALDVAVANDEDDNIRIQAGTLVTLDAVANHAEPRFLEISGGWVASFDSAGSDPADTLLSGNGTQRVMRLTVSQGEVVIRNLSIVEGSAPQGAGADISVEGNGRLQLRGCVFRDNAVTGAAEAQGGGLRLSLFNSADVQLDDCLFEGNSAAGVNASGGGLYVNAQDGELDARRVRIAGNLSDASATALGGGIFIDLGALDAVVELRQSQVRDNLVHGLSGSNGAGLYLTGDGVSQIALVEGAEVAGNIQQGADMAAAQIRLDVNTATVRLRSLAVFDGIGLGGLHAVVNGSAQVIATNLTVSGNDGDGIRFQANSVATQALQNSLSWDNGADLDIDDTGTGGFQDTFNSIGTDPGVVDAAAGDYRLAEGSSQIDVGWPNPIAGLGGQDARGEARVVNLQVDRGAYEFISDTVFGDSFEAD